MDAIRSFLDQVESEAADFGPIPAWWWSGEALEIGRMRWQMDQMRAMGIRQFVVINLAPSGTMFCSDADDPPYMSEAWWTIFRQVCDHARAIGMKIWFYDQIGFSGARYQADIASEHPHHIAQQLRRHSTQGTGELRLKCPDAGEPLAAYEVDSVGNTQAVTIIDRCASVTREQQTTLHLVYTVRQGYDLFAPDACARLLDAVHRQFETHVPDHLGKTIVGSFQDELPDLPTWGPTFADTFAMRFGYRIEHRLGHLFEAGDADARRTRVHFHMHRAALAEDAFFKPFHDWHESRGLRCGFDQQSPAREARVIGAIEKYADYMQTHKWYACPGSDLHGNGKLHASLAFLYQRPRVWLEGFHSTGWGGTIADTFDWMLPYLQHGVTLYNAHAVYYSTRKGWWEWAPPSTCWRQPYAKHYKPFAQMTERLLSLLSRGVQQASVGVLFPTATVQASVGVGAVFDDAKKADAVLHETIGSVRWHQVKTGALDSIALDYHLLDEPSITTSTGEGSITVHDVAMRRIILPHVTTLHQETVSRLVRFAESGGVIVCVGSSMIDVVEGGHIELQRLPHVCCVDSVDELPRVLATAQRHFESTLPALHRRVGDINVLFIPAAHGMATLVKWDSWFAPLETATIVPERYERSVRLSLPRSAMEVRQFDPRDGTLGPAHQTVDGSIEVDFDGSPFAVLLWNADSNGMAGKPGDEPRRVPRGCSSGKPPSWIDDAWSCVYEPTLPDEYADIFDESREYLRWPRTSIFQWSAGETSRPVRATFGPRAVRGDADGTESQLEYSPSFGIERDTTHQLTLGPKGHLPDEFLDLGKLASGERAVVRFVVRSESNRDAVLVISANARKSASVNGWPLDASPVGYRSLLPTSLKQGRNEIELSFIAERAGVVRAGWCLVVPADAALMRTPDRIVAPDSAQSGTTLQFTRRFRLDADVVGFTMKVSSAAVAIICVDEKRLARQGGFDPYRLQSRGMVYTLDLARGEHEIGITALDTGSPVPILVDALGTDSAGTRVAVMSDASWSVSRDEGPPIPVALQLKQDADGAAWHLYRRPSPLPRSAWLERRENQSIVLDLPAEPILAAPSRQTFEWTIPPGARSMTLRLVDAVIEALMVDGIAVEVKQGNVDLANGARCSRAARLVVRSQSVGGAVFDEPITYTLGAGSVQIGDFSRLGLNEFSGAIRLRRTFSIDATDHERIMLDLGHVRGSVEAIINGTSAGICVISPYRFELTNRLRIGKNELELVLTNTLANHLAHWSPTRCVAGDQLGFGIFGPIELRRTL